MLTAVGMAVIFTLTGCGANPSSGNSVDAKRMNDLETEVKGLKEELAKIQDRISMAGDSGEYADQGTDDSGSVTPLKYFTSAVKIETGTRYNTDLNAFANLTNLEELSIDYCPKLTDISAIGSLANLQKLHIEDCDELADISAIGSLANLQELEIWNCEKLTDISVISSLANLQELEIWNCEKLTDISVISGLANLQELSIWDCEKLTDISALSNLTGL